MTRILMTGASGFCGRHLVRYLTAQCAEVHAYSFRTANEQTLAAVIRTVQPDYVFHLAGVAVADDPVTFYLVNTAYAAALLRALEETGRGDCPVLLVGTAAEYGMVSDAELPICEEHPPTPYNDYGVSKVAQTLLGLAAAGRGRPIVVARPFNIIGTGMPSHLVLQSFASQIAQIKRGEAPPVIHVGNLDSMRDFIDIEEVGPIYWKLIQTPAAYGQVVNVCSGRPTKIRAILDALIALSGLSIDVQVEPRRLKPVDVPVHYGSPAKLRRLTGVTPSIPIELSLKSILAGMLHR